MEFTREAVERQFYLLSSSRNEKEREFANIYLVEFQKSQFALEISLQLLETKSEVNQFLGAHLLYQKIKENFSRLMKCEADFLYFRGLLLDKIHNINLYSQKILDRLCISLSVLMIIGIQNYWKDCVSDFVTFGIESIEKCYLVLTVFENISTELDGLNLNESLFFELKDLFEMMFSKIIEFVIRIIPYGDTFKDFKQHSIFHKKLLKLLSQFIYFKCNILNYNYLCSKIIEYSKLTDSRIVINIISECCLKSEFSKIYERDYTFEDIERNFEITTFTSLKIIIEKIYSHLANGDKFLNSNNDIEEIEKFSTLFENILENFIYLLFFKDQNLRDCCFALLKFFVSYDNRKISKKMFGIITELGNFLEITLLDERLNSFEKIEFRNYLISLLEAILMNSKFSNELTDYNINDVICKISKDDDIFQVEQNNLNVTDYRNSSEFIISKTLLLLENLDNGISFYLNQIFTLLENLQRNNLKDDGKDIIEVIIFLFYAISSSIPSEYNDKIYQFTEIIIKSTFLQNQKIFKTFLNFLERNSILISNYEDGFRDTFNLVLGFLIENNIPNSCSEVILLYSETGISDPYFFSCLINAFKESYTKIPVYSSKNIIRSIVNFTRNKFESLENETLYGFYKDLIDFSVQKIEIQTKKAFSLNELEISRTDIIVLITIVNVLFEKIVFIDKIYYVELIEHYFTKFLGNHRQFFSIFNFDSKFIKHFCKLLQMVIPNLEQKITHYFSQIHELLLYVLLRNPNYYQILGILNLIYCQSIKYDYNNVVSNTIRTSFSKITEIISNSISENELQIEIINSFVSYYTNTIKNLRDFFIPRKEFDRDLNIFCNSILKFNDIELLNSLIAFFEILLNSYKQTSDINFYTVSFKIISTVIESLSNFHFSHVSRISNLIICSFQLNHEETLKGLSQGFENEIFDKLLKDDKEFIIKYFFYYKTNEREVKPIIQLIMEISKHQERSYDLSCFREKIRKESLSDLCI